MTEEEIARVAHNVNKAACAAFGDFSQPSWENAPNWQRDSAIQGVRFHLNNPNADEKSSHESWLAVKESEGWCYGPVKNIDKKEHPCFVPFEDLPQEQKLKDFLFTAVVRSLSIYAAKE